MFGTGWPFSSTTRPLAVNACHCTDCKKATGATHVIMLIANNDDFSFTGEVQSYRQRADSGRELDIQRCTVCGTRMFHHNLASKALVFIAAVFFVAVDWLISTVVLGLLGL